MEAIEMIKTRRSIRKFTNEKVHIDCIKDAINTTTYSPSWANLQINRYNIIEDDEKKSEFAKACIIGMDWNIKIIENASGIIVTSYVKGKSGFGRNGEPSNSKGDAWGMYDAGIAAQTLSLALHEKGVGSVILGVFDVAKAGEFLNLPENEEVSAIIPYGYPDKIGNMPPRKHIDEIVRIIK